MNSAAWGAPRLDAIWSITPTGAPTNSTSARCPSSASRTSSSSHPNASRSARSIETSSAALDDSPLPSGTSESTRASNPESVLGRATAVTPWT